MGMSGAMDGVTKEDRAKERAAFVKAFKEFDAGVKLLEEAKQSGKKKVWDAPIFEIQKMLWVVEQAKNPDMQPQMVRLPSGVMIQRQQSGVNIQRSVSTKWEDRVMRCIQEARNFPWWLPSCCGGCFGR